MSETRIEPEAVVALVDQYVYSALSDALKFDNSKPLDESGVWSLHALAARIYALGWQDGERAEDRRRSGSRIHDGIRQGETA